MSDGTDLRDDFLLDPSVTFLNHGLFGTCPRAVFERYLARRLEELLAEARRALGASVAPGRAVTR